MHMALNADEWLLLHTAHCNRMTAWITAKTCEGNRLRSGSDSGLNCNGCEGLYNQAEPLELILSRSLQHSLEEILTMDGLQEEGNTYSVEKAGVDTRDLDPGSVDEDALDKELAALFPEYTDSMQLSDLVWEEVCRPVKAQKVKKFAVYMGRCQKCGGYMIFAPEQQFDVKDVEVYRCYSCSWRVSPEYEWNRKHG